jgi:soluble lytic murein transglycosylase-like protein
MTGIQSKILPAALLGCLLIIWIGTMAARALPPTWEVSQTAVQQPTQPIPTSQVVSAEPQAAAVDSACPLSQRYPQAIQQWCSLMQKYASDHQLPLELIAAVMLQESGGNAQAYSSSGAVGLLQVMPRDGLAADFQCINGPCFKTRPTIIELQDPDFNLSFGTHMLAGLVNKYGNVRDALMHYGPANVGYYYADKVLAIYENYR